VIVPAMRKIFGCLIIAIVLVFIASACIQTDLSPEAIIQNMHQAYSEVTSYQESGVIDASTNFENFKISHITDFSI
jgi:outer membrane lipoprotein-sorting protein